MKTILRNFISVLRRFRMATLLNILGLSIAFAAFMVIMMQVSYDYTFDSCQPESEAIYRMDMQYQGELVAVMSRPLARAFTESSPHIKGRNSYDIVDLPTGFTVSNETVRYKIIRTR